MLKTLTQMIKPKHGRERRKAERFPMNSKGELFVCPATSRTVPIHVDVKDASTTGVGVISPEPLTMGEKYVVKEQTLSRGKRVLYTVVRSQTLNDGRFSVGLHASDLIDGAGRRAAAGGGQNAASRLLFLVLIVGICAAAVALFSSAAAH